CSSYCRHVRQAGVERPSGLPGHRDARQRCQGPARIQGPAGAGGAQDMKVIDFESVDKGTPLEGLSIPALTRVTLARFAGAVDDYNPMHLDDKVAAAAGKNSVFASAHLVMATMHWEEEYEYFRPICAGDAISVVHRIADMYDKQAS